jgi:chromosome segregation ATPase
VTKNPREGRKTPTKNKLSETFVMGVHKKKDITGVIDKSLNMRSFNFDSDEIRQRRTIKQMAKMYSEIDDLKKQIKNLKSENKILKQTKTSIVDKSHKSSRKQKKIDKILKEAGTSLIDIQKDIDQSLVEISFLKQKNESQEMDNKAEMMSKLNKRKQKLNEMKQKRLQNEKVSNSLLEKSPVDRSSIENMINDAKVNQIIQRMK